MSALPDVRPALAECETVIERGLATFVEVGAALLRIRDDRLYRDDYQTFEDYCQQRWGFSRQRAHQLTGAAEMSTVVDIPSERVARELAPLRSDPETLRETWAEVVDLHGDTPTATQVKDVVDNKVGRMAVHYSSQTDEWATPQDFFDAVDAEFRFTLDACALASSAKCERFFSPEKDGLAQDWTGRVWMNPPYGDVIGRWVQKAHESATAGVTVVCLVPARTDTAWFHDFCFPWEVRFIRSRLRFGTADASAPFPSCLVAMGPAFSRRAYGWEWR